MIKRDTSHWSDIKSLEGLLFFSQLIDEMLFSRTLESYKPSALNSKLLCKECLVQIQEVRSGFIIKKNLDAIVDELHWSLEKDPAAKSILGHKLYPYLSRLKGKVGNIDELETLISFIYRKFYGRKYFNSIKECILQCLKDSKQKANLKTLTNSFITELISTTYTREEINYQNFIHFISPNSAVNDLNKVESFFDAFNFEEKKFTVVFIGGRIYQAFRDSLNRFDIVVTNTYNTFTKLKEDLEFEASRKSDESFIICSNIKAFDSFSARTRAESKLRKIANIFSFYHHHNVAELKDDVLVCRMGDNFTKVIDRSLDSILHVKHDLSPVKAAEKVGIILEKLLFDKNSAYRTFRSLDLHTAALVTTEPRSQLLNLWAALETLLPKAVESNIARIDQVCTSLVPFLQHNYTQKHLEQVYEDLARWDLSKTADALNNVADAGNLSLIERVAALISLDCNAELRRVLYAELNDFPLLKNRVFTLHETFKTPKSIKAALDSHKAKIEWHIRRIYRTRGQIIHSGKSPSFLPILVENLHNYFDIFFKQVFALAVEDEIKSIEEGVLHMQLQIEQHYELLKKHEKEDLSNQNFKEVILGIKG